MKGLADQMIYEQIYGLIAEQIAIYSKALQARRLPTGTIGYLLSQHQAHLYDVLTLQVQQDVALAQMAEENACEQKSEDSSVQA